MTSDRDSSALRRAGAGRRRSAAGGAAVAGRRNSPDHTNRASPSAAPRPSTSRATMARVIPSLEQTIRELDIYVAADGWDQPTRLFAIADTQQLLDARARR